RLGGSKVLEALLFLRIRIAFFFQAEDGIRDYKVTGVQTCALPIYLEPPQRPVVEGLIAPAPDVHCEPDGVRRLLLPAAQERDQEIGRASCRERVYNGGVAGSIKKKHEKRLTGLLPLVDVGELCKQR